MKLQAKTEMTIAKPSDVVFNAIAKAKEITNYWATKSNSDLITDTITEWTMSDYGNVIVTLATQKLEKGKRIIFEWDATGSKTKVEFILKPSGKKTLVQVNESGWKDTPKGIKNYAINTGGWVSFLCFLKAYLEFGVNLRKGAYK